MTIYLNKGTLVSHCNEQQLALAHNQRRREHERRVKRDDTVRHIGHSRCCRRRRNDARHLRQ